MLWKHLRVDWQYAYNVGSGLLTKHDTEQLFLANEPRAYKTYVYPANVVRIRPLFSFLGTKTGITEPRVGTNLAKILRFLVIKGLWGSDYNFV